MSRLEAHDTPWADFATVIQGNGAAEPKATCPVNRSEQERQRWQAVLACQLAGDLRDAGAPGPQRVAATGDGGIVFVRQVGPSLSTLEVGADGSIELTVFRDSRLLSRQRLR